MRRTAALCLALLCGTMAHVHVGDSKLFRSVDADRDGALDKAEMANVGVCNVQQRTSVHSAGHAG